jgi:hypothetical protein
MRIAGVILDIYDDPKALVLRQKLAGKALPEKLAGAALLDANDLEALPDRLFGLVATIGDDKLRKFAMHDEAHVATSIVYFMTCGHLLPDEARAKVAANLVNACAWYDMDPPEGLVKRAMVGRALGALGTAATLGLGGMDVAHRAKETSERNRQSFDRFRVAQASGAKVAGREVELSMSEDQRVQDGGESNRVMPTIAQIAQHGPSSRKLDKQTKQADLNGTEIMPYGALSKPTRNNPSKNVSLPAKTAAGKLASAAIAKGWRDAGDLTRAEPRQQVKQAEASRFALPHRQSYPIDTTEQVKRAEAYFDTYAAEFELLDRRVFAQALVARGEELGMKVAGAALGYAGTAYGPYIDTELTARIRGFEGTGHETVYELLQEKRAEVSPLVMVQMLKEADQKTGADRSYGRPGVGLRDPYQAVYGIKEAKTDKVETYSWAEGTDYVSGMMLSSLASGAANLDDLFGKGFTKQFRNDPVAMFESLPDPQKVVLSRMASDNSSDVSSRI